MIGEPEVITCIRKDMTLLISILVCIKLSSDTEKNLYRLLDHVSVSIIQINAYINLHVLKSNRITGPGGGGARGAVNS